MIVLYVGARGKGKTLTMNKDGYNFKCKGFEVFANFECSFAKEISNDEIMELNKGSELYDCVILIDEIQIFFDSRRGMYKRNIDFSNFIQQSRKRNINILCTTQYSNTIDLRLRQHLDVMAYPNFIKDLNVCEVTYKDLTTIENDIITGLITEPKSVKIVYNAEKVFNMYNTNEMIR